MHKACTALKNLKVTENEIGISDLIFIILALSWDKYILVLNSNYSKNNYLPFKSWNFFYSKIIAQNWEQYSQIYW